MSYISLLLPAFHLNTIDINDIIKQCSIQFNLTPDEFEVLEINDKTNNINYGIKLNESSLSLSSIEDLIYQRNCMQSLSEKVFESLQLMTKRLNELINSFKENGNSEEFKKDLMNDNIKLRELLVSQIEYSDNFRINTEKTLNRIKDEFRTMVKELETLKKKSNKDEQINSIGGPVKKSGNTNNNNINNQKVNFSASSTNINNQGNDNNYSLPLKVNLIK
jgi:hypothetical protein